MKHLLEELSKRAEGIGTIDEEAFYAHGYSLYRSGEAKQAAETFRILCMRNPFEVRFWFGLGAALQESKEWQGALYAWAMAATLDLEDPYPHFHAAECSYSIGEKTDAKAALQEAKDRIEKNHPLAGPIEALTECWSML